MNNPRVLFIASGPRAWASARMRAYWVAEHLPNARAIDSKALQPGTPLPDADCYIWQKIAQPQIMAAQLQQGAQVWWDNCDPMWWWSPDECREILGTVTGVTCSNVALAHDLQSWMFPRELPVYVIPDRLDFAHFPKRHEHYAANPTRLIWFGLAVNRIGLYSALANLERLVANRHLIELTICDDQPDAEFGATDSFPIYQVRWSLEMENEILAAHDIALLPPYPGPWGKVKSENRKITAAACGLPTCDGLDYEELCRLVDYASVRLEVSEAAYRSARAGYDVSQSAHEWAKIIRTGNAPVTITDFIVPDAMAERLAQDGL